MLKPAGRDVNGEICPAVPSVAKISAAIAAMSPRPAAISGEAAIRFTPAAEFIPGNQTKNQGAGRGSLPLIRTTRDSEPP